MKKNPTEVYIALGGNVGPIVETLNTALKMIGDTPNIFSLRSSRFYLTTPVSLIPQNHFLNSVASFQTSLSAPELFESLCKIEKFLGKTKKTKEDPRRIDIDLLFFGQETYKSPDLEIPHPRWSERLFVLKPLSDLTDQLFIPDLECEGRIRKIEMNSLLASFANIHQETVTLYGAPCIKYK